MGRDITGIHIDKKTSSVNVKPNVAIHAAARDVSETVETKDSNPEDDIVQVKLLDICNERQAAVKSTIRQPQEEKIMADEAQTLTDNVLSSLENPAPGSSANETSNAKSVECLAPSLEVETSDSGVKCSSKSNDVYSPSTAKKSQPDFPLDSRKHLQPKYCDDDDNWSMASSTATSRATKSQVTVPVAPSFVCSDRAERRKEFYAKLDEKHKALEQEKIEYQARTKEEELAGIKQLRKSMTYKANPVPKFYREGPPPKVELKKLPVTRAKSPNLSRRKSCGDAVTSLQLEKGSMAQPFHHSIGANREGKTSPITPKSVNRIGLRKSNGTSETKDRQRHLKETVGHSTVKDLGNDIVSIES